MLTAMAVPPATLVQLPAFRQAGLKVTALWARNDHKAHQLGEEHGLAGCSGDPEAFVRRHDVDLLSIATPPKSHCHLLRAALEAGKHVICEKPVAMDVEEARTMAAAARAAPSQLAVVDHELRFLPTTQAFRHLVQSGKCGQVQHVEAMLHRSARLAPGIVFDWWSDAAHGGGALGAVGSHLLDMMAWVTGQHPSAVCAQLRAIIPTRPTAMGDDMCAVTADERADLLLRYRHGVTGTLAVNFASALRPVMRVAVAGTEATAVWESDTAGVTVKLIDHARDTRADTSADLAAQDEFEGVDPPALRNPFGLGTLLMAQALYAALNEGGGAEALREVRDTAASLEEAVQVQRTMDAARRSSTEGRWVALDEL